MEKINWGIIGLGNVAHKFSEAFKDIKNSKLLAAASKDKDKLNIFKEKYNFEDKFLFNTYEELIDCKDVDIIYIALPNFLHHKWAVKCIQNNKNILVEKPATLNLSETNDIKEKLQSKNLFFGEAFMYRYNPQIKSVINLIKNNKIGKPLSMKSNFGNNVWFKRKLFFFKKKKKIDKNNRLFNKDFGGGCILDLGCYPSSFSLLINSLIGNSNFKLKNVTKELCETGVDIDSYADIVFESGFKSSLYSSFKKNLRSSIIEGEKGSITINDTWSSKDSIEIKSDKNYSIKSDDDKNIYSHQIECISENLLKKDYKPAFPVMTLSETIQNMEIMDMWLNT